MSTSPEPADGATVELTPDQAIVLFELLSRWSGKDEAGETPTASCFVSPAEGAVLNALLCELEKQLSEPFGGDYEEVLEAARRRLAIGWSYLTLRG